MMPNIQELMVKQPHTIGKDQLLSKAQEMMREYKIRHLPVQYGGKIVGILTDRDIHLAFSILPGAKNLRVEEVMVDGPYAVTGNTPADEVLREMVRNRYGCTIIKDEKERAIGIFTATDAIRVLAETYVHHSTPLTLSYATESDVARGKR